MREGGFKEGIPRSGLEGRCAYATGGIKEGHGARFTTPTPTAPQTHDDDHLPLCPLGAQGRGDRVRQRAMEHVSIPPVFVAGRVFSLGRARAALRLCAPVLLPRASREDRWRNTLTRRCAPR